MGDFWNLVGFEYKKLTRRKSFLLALALLVFVSTFCMVGNTAITSEYDGESMWETMARERENIHKVAGSFDAAMVDDILQKNSRAAAAAGPGERYPDDVYETCIQPYQTLRAKLFAVLSPIGSVDPQALNGLATGQEVDYYGLRRERLAQLAALKGYSQQETAAALQSDKAVKTPYIYDYFGGYSNFFYMMSTSAVFIVFALVICVAPIFADEYQKRTDAVVLASKYGKTKLAGAKIFTAFSFCLLFTMLALGVALATTFTVYGTLGGGVSFQIFDTFSVYPLQMAGALAVYCGVIVGAALLLTSFALLLSAYSSSFAAVVASALLLFGSMFFDVPSEALRLLGYFLPAKMMDVSTVFSTRLVPFFGAFVKPYFFIPCLCALLAALLFWLARRGFKRHQVG